MLKIKGQVFIIFFMLFCALSCKEKKVELLVPDEKMVNVLVDLHIAEAAILSASKAQKDSIGGVYFAQVFEMYQIRDSLFYQNLELISRDPIRTAEIYEKVIEKIEKLDLEEKSESDKEASDKKEKKDEVGTKKK